MGFYSKDCPRNCLDHYQNGSTSDGVYLIYPDEEEPFQVLCDMTTNGRFGKVKPRSIARKDYLLTLRGLFFAQAFDYNQNILAS